MKRSKPKFVLVCLSFGLVAGCARTSIEPLPAEARDAKVLVIGMSGVTWRDLIDAKSPYLERWLETALIANVSVRVSNIAAEAYASLGAGQRTHVNPSAGWAFRVSEKIENGTAGDMYSRRTNMEPQGEVLVPLIGAVVDLNHGVAFNATPGALSSALMAQGKTTAVIGNADYSLGALPAILPNQETMQRRDAPDVGIHREAALVAMDPHGRVPLGDVSRQLLRAAEETSFGVTGNQEALLDEFRRVWAGSDLVVVETGETFRADSYSVGLADSEQRRHRLAAISRSAEFISALISEVDLSSDLVVIFSATTPGGARARGQLRPLMMFGGGIEGGLASSPSTRREGLVVVPDITATIARHLGASEERFEGGHVIGTASSGRAESLVAMNDRAVVQDLLRTPIAAIFVGLQLLIFGIALSILGRKGKVPGGLVFALLVMLSFPVASFAPNFGFWKLGAVASGLIVGAESVVIALAALVISRRRLIPAATFIVGLTAFFFVVDLVYGTPAQLDSVLGYTAVAAGRFYGLGNLGFAIFASAAIILASSLADAKRTVVAIAVLIVALGMIGLPQLGNDFGGTLTMVVSIAIFTFVMFKKRSFPTRLIPLALVAGVVVLLIFGAIDLARPATERTHIGDFLSSAINDPAYVWLVSQRKLGLAVSLAVSSRWGLAIPITIPVLIWLYRRRRGILEQRTALRAGLEALIAAAILGSLVNDSGVAVAGMMLAMGVPWALLATAEVEGAVVA